MQDLQGRKNLCKKSKKTNILNEPVTILIPKVRSELAKWACSGYELRTTRSTNRRVKMVDTYCRLKAFAGVSGLIKNWNSQKANILSFCEISRNPFMERLADLKKEGFIYYDKNCIKLNSLKAIYATLELNYKPTETVFPLPQKISDEKQTHYWIYLAEINNNRSCQAYTFVKKLMQNPDLKLWLFGYLSAKKIDISKTENDFEAICSLMKAEYLDGFVFKESEMYEWLCENRPDINRGVRRIAKHWDTKPMNVCYAKKKFSLEQLAFVEKPGVIESTRRARNKHIHIKVVDGFEKATGVMWNEKNATTAQHFCDDIAPRKPLMTETERKSLAHAA